MRGDKDRCQLSEKRELAMTHDKTWCLGRESNPYGLRRGIFFTLRLSPPAAAVRALDYAFTMALRAVGAPRLVSTPSPCEAWLGVASAIAARGFTEFEGIHAGAFASRCSIL